MLGFVSVSGVRKCQVVFACLRSCVGSYFVSTLFRPMRTYVGVCALAVRMFDKECLWSQVCALTWVRVCLCECARLRSTMYVCGYAHKCECKCVHVSLGAQVRV